MDTAADADRAALRAGHVSPVAAAMTARCIARAVGMRAKRSSEAFPEMTGRSAKPPLLCVIGRRLDAATRSGSFLRFADLRPRSKARDVDGAVVSGESVT